MSAYYPVVLTGASLIVCFWAEVFHLREIRWDRPRFLSKSFLGFLAFNIITYTLLVTELFLVWIEHEHREFYTHIFNGCYAVLMFVVVVFFLIYGVEVFFKVRSI
jgi:von Hippel-Lindau disease tumor supressor